MSTEDRTQRTEPCMCGARCILIEESTPEHPWARARQTSYTCEIQCEPCSREYLIQDGGVVRRVDDRRIQAEAKYEAARLKLMRSDLVVALLKSVASYLDQKPSTAVIYRCLDAHRLAQYSKSHFCRKWRGGTDWAQSVYYRHLPQLLALLGRDTSEADVALAALAEIEAAIPQVPVLRRLHPTALEIRQR